MIKITRSTLYFFLILLLLSGTHCSVSSILQKKDIRHAAVTITRIASNDLGQVVIFSRDDENNERVFVKDFYSSFKDRAAQRIEMRRYRKKTERYYRKHVIISYYENRAGNLVITRISPG